MWVHAGSTYPEPFPNFAVLSTGSSFIPDPTVITYNIFKPALLAMVEAWDPVRCTAYSDALRKPVPDGTYFRETWIQYLCPWLASLVTPPTTAIVVHLTDGGLLISATTQTFHVENPAHMAVARDIAAAIAPLNALPWVERARAGADPRLWTDSLNDNFLTVDEFKDAMRKIEPVFHVERRLPEQVFKRPYRLHLLCEFDFAMDDLLQALEKMRSPLTDETALLCVIDPDPITFFYKEFQKIYGFYFKANISTAEYFRMLWVERGPEREPFPFLDTELEVYLSLPASFAMWGERSREFTVIGLDDPALAAFLVNANGYWVDAETALERFAKMPFVDQKVPEDFCRALIAYYRSRADLERKLGQKVEYPWEKETFRLQR